MQDEFITILGKNTGSTSVVLAGVHGDEVCGVQALQELLPTLSIDNGRVLFGYGNPRALTANTRFTEANLNRMFKPDKFLSSVEKGSYEYGRAQFIKKFLDQADALLDIHASFTPQSLPFAICESNAQGIVEYLPIKVVVTGFDKVQPGGTDYYMNTQGKVGICVETGYLAEPQSLTIAKQSVMAFLAARNHRQNSPSPQPQSYVHMYVQYMTKTDRFRLAKPFADFEEVAAGQVIGIDGEEEVRAEKASVIVFARNRNHVNDEAFLLGEKKNRLE